MLGPYFAIFVKAPYMDFYSKMASALFPFNFSLFSQTTILSLSNSANPLISLSKYFLTSQFEIVLY